MDAIPMHEANFAVSIKPKGQQSEVTWTFDYRVKYGPLGWRLA